MSFNKWILASLICLLSFSSHAAVVTAVKGQKAMIDLEGATSEVGDEFFLIDPASRKKTAIVRVRQVKGSRAIVDILKGRANQGYTLQAKAPSGPARPMSSGVSDHAEQNSNAYSSSAKYLSMIKESYGVTAAYQMNSMQANVSYRDQLGTVLRSDVSMSGTGFGLGGFYDMPFTPTIVGRVFAGLEQFNATGSASTAACMGSTECNAKITYFSGYGLGKWYFLPGQYRSWVGAGAGFLLALSKSSTALNESQISTNQVFTLAGGVDVQMSRRNYIPISLEYNLFPDSSTVKASTIILKAGWAWNL